jgi:RNA-directed DNA polymerase
MIMPTLIDKIKSDLVIDDEYISRIIKRQSKDIHPIQIPKKNGGFRIAYQIAIEFKPLQYWLINNLFSLFDVYGNAYAYIKEKSIKMNAECHLQNTYFLKIDFSDFFPSITYDSVKQFIQKNRDKYEKQFSLTKDSYELIKKCCFDNNERLAQGFSSSPVITNIIMFEVDMAICEILKKFQEANPIYTRYSDDIVISCSKKGVSYTIFRELKALIYANVNPVLKINTKKTSFGSVARGNVLVTGLKITSEQKIELTKQRKDEIDLLLKLIRKGKIQPNEVEKIKGKLEFIKHNTPDFYTKLKIKYFNEIESLNK